jgi:hypothetical protein
LRCSEFSVKKVEEISEAIAAMDNTLEAGASGSGKGGATDVILVSHDKVDV